MRRSPQTGWTLIEVVIASGLVLAIMAKAALVTSTALGLANDESASMHTEDQARAVLDRIALAVMGSDRDSLLPQIEELHSDHIRYSFSLGVEEGEVVWSEPEEIRLVHERAAVEWRENPDEAAERRATWTTLVSPLLEGELENGSDDNGNGLIDEEGLSFVLDGDRVVIRLTLRRTDSDGRSFQESVEAVVCCRN